MDSDVGADGDSDRHIDSQIEYAPRHSALNAGHNIWVAGPRPLAEMGANFDRAVRACAAKLSPFAAYETHFSKRPREGWSASVWERFRAWRRAADPDRSALSFPIHIGSVLAHI